MIRLLAILTLPLALLPAAGARAAWQASRPLDGPSADVLGLGGVSLARDGTGGVAYLRRDGGVPHVFVTRMTGGAWQAPERVDPTGPASEAQIAAADAGRLAVAWISGGTVFGTVAGAGAPFAAPVALGGPGAASLHLAMGLNGVAYAVWQQGGDVRAARLLDATWTTIGTPLDINPPLAAGTGALRPRVAVSAEGYALVAWGEQGTDGRTHVYARRLIGTTPSAFPQDATPPGGGADSPEVSTQWDGSFEWVAFRQDVGGVSHSIGRRFLGSTFEPPVPLDGGSASVSPSVSVNGRGDGAAVAQVGGTVMSPVLDHDAFLPSVRLDAGTGTPVGPVVRSTDDGDIAAAWQVQLPDGRRQARGSFKELGEPYGPDTQLSRDDLGTVDDPGLAIAGDRVGDYAVAMVQGPDGARTLAVTVFDRPAGRPAVAGSAAYTRPRPTLRWVAGLDLWGPQTFTVVIDGVPAGSTQAHAFTPAKRLSGGRHSYRIDAVDEAGQVTSSHIRTVRVDARAPRLRVSVKGARRAGRVLRISAHATDRGGSGLAHVTIAFGDRARSVRARSARHAYRRGRFTLTVSAVDKAGNVARRSVKLRIR